ncbi:Fc receptor-like protein 5 [Acipenser ruthenus]|uniref:Fc receptor-like protein 5 n=1 Tax=Acipenser ruthenus TaxID=7906 RepID=UPI002741BFD0|nr:Fc receptor-like protein 5 [Acipenser ruthenus]
MRPVGLSIIRFLTTVACFGAFGEGHQRPVLSRIPPEGDAFEGDTVTLVCQVEGNPEEWEYLWYKDRILDRKTETPPINTSYIISPASPSDNGEYRCQARRKDDRTTHYYSTSIGLQVSELFTRPSMTAPLWNPVWERESFTLQCQVQFNNRRNVTDIRYLFIKDGKELESAGPPGNYTIPAARAEDAGRYECQVEAGGVRKASDSVEVNVRAGMPRTTLTLEHPWGEMFVGERVSLTCLVEGDSAGWKYLWYKDSQTAPLPQPESSSDAGARYTISAAALSHSGEYWCRAARGAGYFHSDYSKAARLKVSDPPKIILTLLPSRTDIFTGDNVTLRCEVGLSSYSWQYHWYKGNRQSLAPGSGNASGATYTISSAAMSHAGQYWCQAAKQDGSFCLNYSQPVMLVVHERPAAVLTLEEGWTEVFVPEFAILGCRVPGNYTEWNYTWYKDEEAVQVFQQNSSSLNDNRYTISSANESNGGRYTCRGERASIPVYSNTSDVIVLTISKNLPNIVLTLEPAGTEIFEGDNITLSCDVEGNSTGWTYYWYKGCQGKEVYMTDSRHGSEANYTISAAALSHTGSYCCQAFRGVTPLYLDYSQPVLLNVHERPQAVLIQGYEWGVFYTAEIAVLECQVKWRDLEWSYRWYKDGLLQTEGSGKDGKLMIHSKESDRGEYTCQGERTSNPFHSTISSPFMLNVSGDVPKAVLTLEPEREAFEGDSVTLRCEVQGSSTGWKYHWYKNQQGNELLQTDSSGTGGIYTISAAALNNTGEYWCRAARGDPEFDLGFSQAIVLNVSELFSKPVVTAHPDSPVWEGDSLTLHCAVRVNEKSPDPKLRYHFIREEGGWKISGSKEKYILPGAKLSDSGKYWCEVQATRNELKKRSDPVGVTVGDRPQAVLTLQPQWPQLYFGETLTLRCGVAGEYPGLEYQWFKGSQLTPVPRTADHIVKGSRYTMTAVLLSDQGEYRCLAVRGQPPYPSHLSDSVLVNVSAEQPKAVLTLTPDWTILFPGEKVTLQCLGSPRAVLYKQYRAGEEEQGQEPQCIGKGTSCTVQKAEESHPGLYWCEDKEGQERSKSVDLKVSNASVILQTPPQPLTEGDKLTLLCRARDTKVDPKRITFEYYKNNESLEFQPSTGVTIPAVMKKDAGLYKCFAYSRGRVLGESEVEVSVRDFFARVTLTASPGPAVLEGEPVNLTCEVERNTYLSPPVNYTFLRDGAPLAASSGTAQYFITAMNKTHTGRYSCTAETWPGIRKQSAAVKIELATPWWWIVAGASGSGLLLILITSTLLCCRTRRTAGKHRKSKSETVYAVFDPAKKQRDRLKKSDSEGFYTLIDSTSNQDAPQMTNSDPLYSKVGPKRSRDEPEMADSGVFYSLLNPKNNTDNPQMADSGTVYSLVDPKNNSDNHRMGNSKDLYSMIDLKNKKKEKLLMANSVSLYSVVDLKNKNKGDGSRNAGGKEADRETGSYAQESIYEEVMI